MSASSLHDVDVVMPNVLTELCRVCLQLPEGEERLDLSTIYDEDENLTYAECFTICTQIDLSEGENIPHNLCTSCGLELQMSYDFYKKVEDSKRTLEQYKQEVLEDTIKCNNIKLEESERLPEQEDLLPKDSLHLKDKIEEKEDSFSNSNKTENVEILVESDGFEIIDMIDTDYEGITESVHSQSDMEVHKDDDGITGHQDDVEDGISLMEEHLDMNDYQSIEALEDDEAEAETLQTKTEGHILPVQLIEMESQENYKIINVNQQYTSQQIKAESEEEDQNKKSRNQSKIQSQQISTTVGLSVKHCRTPPQSDIDVSDYCRSSSVDRLLRERKHSDNSHDKWQENVVTVANKEHLPLEAGEDEEEGKSFDEPFEYELLLSSDDLDIEEGSSSMGAAGQNDKKPRKRHIGSYTCEYCLKLFPNYSRMMNHRKCHESDRPRFPCDLCNRIYATKQAMECHVQTEHDKTGFLCTVCSKIFAIRRSLEVHMRYHNGDFPYECNLCDKKFAQLCHLKTHKNVKHNNVRFACEYPNCGKFFTSSTSLRNHEYSHGVMPFECDHCQRGYPAKAKLKTHIKRKHGLDLSSEQLESMRKFHVMRSKVNLVQVVPADEDPIGKESRSKEIK